MKVYLAFALSYSSRYCAGVYSDIEEAQKKSIQKNGIGSLADVEEFDLDEDPVSSTWEKNGKRKYFVRISSKNTEVFRVHPDFLPVERIIDYPYRRFEITVWAKDREHAAKIASEKRAQFIVEEEFVEY